MYLRVSEVVEEGGSEEREENCRGFKRGFWWWKWEVDVRDLMGFWWWL